MINLLDTPGRDPSRVVIIGGGLAGLSAAEAIARVGGQRIRITLLESRRVAGGRVGSFSDDVTGESIDYCQHVTMGCCTNFISLLERSGQIDDWPRYSSLIFLHPQTGASRFAPSRLLSPPLHLAVTLKQLKYLARDSRRRIKHGLLRLMRTPAIELQDRSARDWLQANGQDDTTITLFWDVILVSALGDRTDCVSMAAARKVIIDGFAAARGASDVLVPRKPLSNLIGDVLSAHVARSGVEFRRGVTATGLQRTSNDALQVETYSGEQLTAEHVIIAAPWFAAAKLLRASSFAEAFPLLDELQTLPASPITGVHLWLDREIMQEPHAAIVGLLPQWIFRQPIDVKSSGDEHYYQVVISGSRDIRGRDKAALVAQIMSDLSRVLPAANHANVMRFKMVTDPQSVFSVSPEVDRLRPQSRTPVKGLYLAGDWTQTGWAATMEGAVISGMIAANQVLAHEALPELKIDPGLPRGWLARWLIRD